MNIEKEKEKLTTAYNVLEEIEICDRLIDETKESIKNGFDSRNIPGMKDFHKSNLNELKIDIKKLEKKYFLILSTPIPKDIEHPKEMKCLKTILDVEEFVKKADKLYPFLNKSSKRIYSDPRNITGAIIHEFTRKPDVYNEGQRLKIGFVNTYELAWAIGLGDHSAIFHCLRKTNALKDTVEYGAMYNEIYALINNDSK